MATTLAYMAARGDDRIAACTFFTAQVDFTEPGELGVFIDEDQLAGVEEVMSKKGYLDGTEMATTFNMLRANDLIWSFVVNNYLMGKDPFPFDLLFWNADATRMPAAMHIYYLRNMYQKNLLAQPGGLVIDNVPIDLRKISIPVYMQAGKEDHIAPAKSVYKATQIFSGPVRFMLAGSGHIAGVVNPPRSKKYQHWLNETAKNPPTLDEWQAGAQEYPGSWWNDWDKWLSEKSGAKVPARVPGDGGLPAIEDAPGSYVKVRTDRLSGELAQLAQPLLPKADGPLHVQNCASAPLRSAILSLPIGTSSFGNAAGGTNFRNFRSGVVVRPRRDTGKCAPSLGLCCREYMPISPISALLQNRAHTVSGATGVIAVPRGDQRI